MKKTVVALLVLFSVPAFVQAQTLTYEEYLRNAALTSFYEADARATVNLLTDPLLRGRGTKDPGFDYAARMMARQLDQFGYRPLLGNSFLVEFTAKDSVSRYVLTSAGFGIQDEGPEFRSKNVIGYIPGKSKEVVLISAHLDHIGYSLADNKVFFPGADDNASGVAAVLQVARAFFKLSSKVPLDRGVVIALWGGEELGLLGSADFVKTLKGPNNPYPFSLDDIVFVMNMDMVGRRFDDDSTADGMTKKVVVIGAPETKTCSDLLQKSAMVATALKNAILYYEPNLVAKCNDDDKKFFFRTDSFSFANTKPELATLFFTGPEHKDYHRATDTPEKLDYDRLTRIARLAFVITAQIVQSPERPVCTGCKS